MTATSPIFKNKARAKVNLTLHVGGRHSVERPEVVDQPSLGGLHFLNSLVVFADVGDDLTAILADKFSLEIDGPFSEGLSNAEDNLVLKAVRQASLFNGVSREAAYRLTKNLPVASGIGGGSADAAAAVRLLGLINGEIDDQMEYLLLETGADVPVCYLSKTCIMEGVGEQLTPLSGMGQLHAILINPGVAVSTKQIFEIFDANGVIENTLPKGHVAGSHSLLEMAKAGHNDLQAAAIALAPVIQTVLDEIDAQAGCQLARMSGSGATCFGIFSTGEGADLAAKTLKEKHPEWWCVSTTLGEAG